MTSLARTILVALALLGGCARHDAPTAEFARAKQAYDDAMAATADTTYGGPRWDEVIKLLRAVPEKNAHEHHTAAILADDIEGTRNKAAAQIAHGQAQATRLLDVQSLPPLPTPAPPRPPDAHGTPTAAAGAQPAVPPPTSTPTTTPLSVPANKCGRQCQDAFDDCLTAAGCKQSGSSWSCADASKMTTCGASLSACGKDCG